MMPYQLTDFLPTTKKEIKLRGWDDVDVVLFSGDAYVDHPSFGASVIGRVMEAEGLRVAIVPQPDWHGDFRDFKKFGRPRLFFAISAGCMDSMVNHYTANKRLRSNDAYSPNGQAGLRPDNATIVYSKILKNLYPDVPLVIGGIEASLRRFSHYDYWADSVHKSILVDTQADLLVYGMGEQPIRALVRALQNGKSLTDCRNIPQIAYLSATQPKCDDQVLLASHTVCARDKRQMAITFRTIEEESNKLNQKHLVQPVDNRFVVVNPSFPPMTTEELDAVHDLPFTRLPHPKYKGKTIPAFDMIRFSVNTHRGCFGGCAFCTISMHQGKFVVSRSAESVLKEVQKIAEMPDFKGYLSDLGGPSANMYQMRGRDLELCVKCKRPSCIFPQVCKNMNTDHRPLLDLYRRVDALPCVKKSFIGSGIRYDLLLHRTGNETVDKANREYTRELITKHVSGRLKVAPEHTSDAVLAVMRKPNFSLFREFKRIFDKINADEHLNQQLIPYFISSHPGCELQDMAELAVETKNLNFQLEQVQDFTPTPMTLATEMYHTGLNPYTLKPIFVARKQSEKLAQRHFFFWYKPETRTQIKRELQRMGRTDLIDKLFGKTKKR
ncbi:MAG TPA: YgiQ family radical SAM protein [Paludibacteraceae bacterium]|nr:YgiQ family radical SAM protein [Paludibacteraceae bacterium]